MAAAHRGQYCEWRPPAAIRPTDWFADLIMRSILLVGQNPQVVGVCHGSIRDVRLAAEGR
jgi:hypothetical protein